MIKKKKTDEASLSGYRKKEKRGFLRASGAHMERKKGRKGKSSLFWKKLVSRRQGRHTQYFPPTKKKKKGKDYSLFDGEKRSRGQRRADPGQGHKRACYRGEEKREPSHRVGELPESAWVALSKRERGRLWLKKGREGNRKKKEDSLRSLAQGGGHKGEDRVSPDIQKRDASFRSMRGGGKIYLVAGVKKGNRFSAGPAY